MQSKKKKTIIHETGRQSSLDNINQYFSFSNITFFNNIICVRSYATWHKLYTNIQRLNTMYSELQIQVHGKQTEKETQYIYRQW